MSTIDEIKDTTSWVSRQDPKNILIAVLLILVASAGGYVIFREKHGDSASAQVASNCEQTVAAMQARSLIKDSLYNAQVRLNQQLLLDEVQRERDINKQNEASEHRVDSARSLLKPIQ